MNRKKWIIFFIILFLAVISRIYLLDLRPLHHDEGNNYHFANILLETGRFTYNPENFHGPLYFFSLFLSFLGFGISEYSLRFPAALFGIILVMLPFFIRIERKFPYFLASILLIISPSLLYYARYSIHETLFVLIGICLLYLLTKLYETKNIYYLPYVGFFLALLLATKETSIITLVAIAAALVTTHRDWKFFNWKKHSGILVASLYIFGLLYIALFSSFFTNLKGITDSLVGYAPWIERSQSDVGHVKPFYYYFILILVYEAPILILGAVGSVMGFLHKNAFIKNLAIFSLVQLLVYSLIPYKMPWLVINFTAPLCFLAAYGLWKFPLRHARLPLMALTLIYLMALSFATSFLKPWQKTNWYAYVHSDSDILNLVELVKNSSLDDPRVAMVSDVYWPLPFYLRQRNVDYFPGVEEFDLTKYESYRTLIVDDKVFKPDSLPTDYASSRFTLRNNTYLHVVYKKR